MKNHRSKRKDYFNQFVGSIIAAISAYLVGLSGVSGVWIPAWYRKDEDSYMTIVFIIGMTGMFFTTAIIYRRLRSIEDRTERLEQGFSGNLWSWARKRFRSQSAQIGALKTKLESKSIKRTRSTK